MTICLYVVFYSRIQSKPTSAGFWFILLMGIAIGLTVSRFFDWLKDRDKKS